MIRKVNIQDCQEIEKIEDECFGVDAFTLPQIKYLISKANAESYCEIEDSEIAGYICILFKKDAIFGRLYSLAVRNKFRGRGIARNLLLKIIEISKKRDIQKLFLEVNETNLGAIKLYESMGFIKTGRVENYYNTGDGAIKMSLALN